MDFRRDREHAAFHDRIADFVDEIVIPQAATIDRTDEFPRELVDEIARRGWMGMPFPESIGGAGLDYHAYADGIAELSRGSGGLGTIVAAHTSLAAAMVDQFGDESQRQQYLSPMVAGQDIGAFALSEADAGSDVGSMSTRAASIDGGYRITGQKLWTSNGSVADTVIVFARTDPASGTRGISSFVLRPKEDDGIEVLRTEEKLGDHGCPTAAIGLDAVDVPVDRRLGDENTGFSQALSTLNGGRITIAARSVGIAQGALDATLAHIGSSARYSPSQTTEHRLATMATKLESARYLMHAAAAQRMRGESIIQSAAMAKLHASTVSREVAGAAIEIVGPQGLCDDSAFGRSYRDAKLNEIYEGTSEILKNTIASQLLET